MNTEMESAKLEVVLEATSVNASVPDTTINVTVGDGAKIEVGEAITYIKSGQVEIDEAVAEGKTEITAHTNTKIGEFNANAVEKTNAFNENATNKTTAFNENYTEKKALIDEQVGIATTQAGIATAKATEASQSATSASQSATSAETYAGQAESSASEASTSATNAYASEVNAGQSASDASDSATSASNSASTATTQAGIATTKAGEASTSATNAANSASSASSSASTATTQAGIATTKASEASTSASNASLSEQNASSYADSASQSALDAATSETNASQSASNASQSASTATNQASIATSKAAEASSSATSASNSASSASSSATTATNQANLAKQYAIGEPTEPTEHSAKYWAEQAESELSGLSSRVTTIEGNYVTTDTAQDISAKKTFLGEKAILFKQTATTDKLGFTLYNTSGSELGALEYRPNTISGGALINLNTSQSGTSWLGFRYWSNINIIAPKPSNGNYYIPVNFTDGTNTVTASSNGTVNLSSILPNSAVWGNITGTLSNQTDLQNALDGKQDFISDLSTIRSGAELGATSIQPNDNVSELTNDAGYITGITSSDVTTALGYTPYNSTNPAGYTSNVGTVTSVNNVSPVNGNVTLSIPTVDQTYDGTSTNAQSGTAVAEAIAGVSGANQDLSNLTSQGKNIANWSSNVTNCITEIPQDIKLELNNGTLTLKAGSKVYRPNGAGVFDTRVFTQDVSVSSLGSETGRVLLTYGQSAWSSQETFDYFNISQMNLFSGPSQPTVTSANNMWYDTTNNVIKTTSNTGSTWAVTNNTFPFCIVTASSGTITSIDQVFNGFGYIGSTVFALPGVKGLIPNGRNADGSLKNIESTLTKVHTYWLNPAWGTVFSGHKFYLRVFDEVQGNFAGDVQPDTRVIYSKGISSSTYTGVYYDTEENKWFWVENGEISTHDKMFLGASFIANITPTTFTVAGEWNPRKPFHAIDYSDSSTISGWSMPSSRYIDLTIGASGSTYTAPANGWLSWYCNQNNNGYVFVQSSASLLPNREPSSSNDIASFIPVRKGDRIYVEYNNLVFNRLRFIYAEGEN